MGWSLGWDSKWNRDIGYSVPAYCDHPKCCAEIDRGLAHVCGGEPYGGEKGCGLYFCGEHLYPTFCKSCTQYRKKDYTPKPEHPDWITHKLTDESWQPWRDENPDAVQQLKEMAT
jgi:hypothetical protein